MFRTRPWHITGDLEPAPLSALLWTPPSGSGSWPWPDPQSQKEGTLSLFQSKTFAVHFLRVHLCFQIAGVLRATVHTGPLERPNLYSVIIIYDGILPKSSHTHIPGVSDRRP